MKYFLFFFFFPPYKKLTDNLQSCKMMVSYGVSAAPLIMPVRFKSFGVKPINSNWVINFAPTDI